VPTAFSTDGRDPVDPVRSAQLASYRGRRRREPTPEDDSAGTGTGRGTEPTLPLAVPVLATPTPTILPGASSVAEDAPATPRYLTRAEAKAAAQAQQRRTRQRRPQEQRTQERRTQERRPDRPATPAVAGQLRTPLRQRPVVVDPNARRAPQRRGSATPAKPARGRRGLAAVVAVAAVGGLGVVATAAGALPSEASDQQSAALGPQAAAAVGVLHTEGERTTEQSSASLPGSLGDQAFRMVAVSRSQERGPIGGCSGERPAQHFANGQLPTSTLCSLPFAPGHKLRADAAVRLIRLNEVYKGRFGVDLCLTDSYRSLASQYSVAARKPGLAARPGTSEHGWGLAIDVCGGPDQLGSSRRTWFLANAPAFGWNNPDWARPGGSKPEPWHWEFVEGE
jgi:hypothetical protein